MANETFLVSALNPTGENRQIELAGLDLWPYVTINNVFVYPSEIDVERFKDALAKVLSIWPFVAGIGFAGENHRYFVEMVDIPTPVTFAENNEFDEWPLNSNVIFDLSDQVLSQFYDEVRFLKTFDNVSREPLIRFKITHIVKSNEWVLGSSWSHILGDAASCFHFLNDLSRVYQDLNVSEPLPVFPRVIWKEEESDPSFYSLIKQHRDAKDAEYVRKLFLSGSTEYSLVNLRFSGDQMKRLKSLIDDREVTTHDVLLAYLITVINRSCYSTNNQRKILRSNTTVNFRGVSDSIGSLGLVANGVMMMLSEDFEEPYSIKNVAKTMRKSIQRSREPDFLRVYLATADFLMRSNFKRTLFSDMGLFDNEVTTNSNYRYDWASGVDFGQTDRCRFYTKWSGPLYLRIFRLNPEKNADGWMPRDREGVEIAFQIDTHLKQTLIDAVQRDMDENFTNVQI